MPIYRMTNAEMKRIAKEKGKKTFTVGDLVEAATRKLGVKPCEGCKKRKKSLDRFRIF